MTDTFQWLTVLCVIGLLFSDTKSPAWGFFLGATLALGLYFVANALVTYGL